MLQVQGSHSENHCYRLIVFIQQIIIQYVTVLGTMLGIEDRIVKSTDRVIVVIKLIV